MCRKHRIERPKIVTVPQLLIPLSLNNHKEVVKLCMFKRKQAKISFFAPLGEKKVLTTIDTYKKVNSVHNGQHDVCLTAARSSENMQGRHRGKMRKPLGYETPVKQNFMKITQSKARTALCICYQFNNLFVLEHAKIMITPLSHPLYLLNNLCAKSQLSP